MYIPTQEERYQKKSSLLLMMLCVVVPAALNYYAVLSGSITVPINGGMTVESGSPLGYLNLFCSFSYPLAYLIALVGIDMIYAIYASIVIHTVGLVWLKFRAPYSNKVCVSIALCVGMANLLLLKVL